LADDIAHLPLQRIQPLIEGRDRGLRRRGFVGEASRVGWATPREDLPLQLLHLPLESLQPLVRVGGLPLGKGRRWNERHGGAGQDGRKTQ
jgi:hypothetical protein